MALRIWIFCFSVLLSHCALGKERIKVVVQNPLSSDRTQEIVRLEASELRKRLDCVFFLVKDRNGTLLASQLTSDDGLIFPATVKGNGKSVYFVEKGSQAAMLDTLCFGAYYKHNDDDFSWENDRIGYRAYGKAKRDKGERLYGYDIFLKRNAREPIIPKFIKQDKDPENWRKYNALKATDEEAAERFLRSFSYHVDHGKGMDCYAVGGTLGAFAPAVLSGDTILYAWNYESYEILENGPLRFLAVLTYPERNTGEMQGVREVRQISINAGQWLNRSVVKYRGLKDKTPIVIGCKKHDNSPTLIGRGENTIAYLEPTQAKGNGEVYMGAILPEGCSKAGDILGHAAAILPYDETNGVEYYFGFAWQKAGMRNMDAWRDYLDFMFRCLKNPLRVTLK